MRIDWCRRCVRRWRRGRAVLNHSVMAMTSGRRKLLCDQVNNLFKRNLGRFFPSPIGQCRAGCFGIFKTGNVVARCTRQLGNGLFTNVVEQNSVTLSLVRSRSCSHAIEHLLVALDRRLIGAQTVFEYFLGSRGWKPVF